MKKSRQQCFSQIITENLKNSNFLFSTTDSILLVGPKALRHQIHSLLTPLSGKSCEHAKNLDTDLNFQKHISNITKTAFYHFRNI